MIARAWVLAFGSVWDSDGLSRPGGGRVAKRGGAEPLVRSKRRRGNRMLLTPVNCLLESRTA